MTLYNASGYLNDIWLGFWTKLGIGIGQVNRVRIMVRVKVSTMVDKGIIFQTTEPSEYKTENFVPWEKNNGSILLWTASWNYDKLQ